jgi:Domain of unknown function (DUF4249)
MKNYKIIVAACFITALCSCEKVINVDLENAEPKIVIEGIVDNSGRPAKVSITKSVVFSAGNNTAPKVTGAVVKITDNAGNTFTLSETTAGVYTNALLIGAIGKTYNLSVLAEGKTYTASSIIPRASTLDTLIQDTVFTNKKRIAVNAFVKDNVGFGDNIQVVQTVNGILDKTTYVDNDTFLDGSNLPFTLAENEDLVLKRGDIVKVELRSIDKNVYRYLRGIVDLVGGSTIPANPISNISNGSLGFFSAHVSQTKTIVIQ